MCNWLVCIAVWASYAARDVAGKILIIFFVILLFVVSGFEHSVANMYYIPAGIFAKQNPQWLAASGVSAQQLAGLNWLNFAVKNLIPVTLGNIIGGSVMVGALYWLALGKKGT
jgi:formate/nitrite transporter FocA (FNT family)